MVSVDTLLVKLSKVFCLCDFNRESMRTRVLIQTVDLQYLAVVLLGCMIAVIPRKLKSKRKCPCARNVRL